MGETMIKRIFIMLLMILIVSGCAKPTPDANVTATVTVASQATSAPGVFPTLPAATAVSASSPTPFTPFTVKPTVDNLNVRVGPGYLFDALGLVHQADTVTVLGTAPGHEWTKIRTADGTEGWVFTMLLQSSVDLKQIPLLEPKEIQVIKGRVTDASGLPIPGVAFAAGQSSQADISGNAATTDANGEFYFFIPSAESGEWLVSYTGIACESIVWSDSSCSTYKAGYTGNVDPPTSSFTLPQATPLTFKWK
jgi:SH3-like domain-containing protein